MRQLKLRQPLHPFPFLIFVLMKDKDKSQVMVAVEERELADQLMNFIFDDLGFPDKPHRPFL